MRKVTINEELEAALQAAGEEALLCDQQGRPLGRFLSDEAYHRLLYGSVDVPYSDEEIVRRRAEEGGRELSEIWKDLEQRG